MKRLLTGLLLALAGCAQLPTDLPPRPDLREPATSATLGNLNRETAHAEAVTFLAERWWASFEQTALNRLIETALKDAPDLAAAHARLRMADQAERLARLDAQVHYGTDASLTREHLSRNGLFPPPIGGSTFTQTDITQNLSYSLDWWGRNRALVQAAGNERQAAQDEAAAVRQALAAAVADAYFASADVEARLGVARTLEIDHRKEYGLLKARFDLGLDSAQPLIDARRKLDLDEDRIRGLEYQTRSLRYRLSALIGAGQGAQEVAQGPRQILQPPDPVFVLVQHFAGIDQRLRGIQAQLETRLEQIVCLAVVVLKRAGNPQSRFDIGAGEVGVGDRRRHGQANRCGFVLGRLPLVAGGLHQSPVLPHQSSV